MKQTLIRLRPVGRLGNRTSSTKDCQGRLKSRSLQDYAGGVWSEALGRTGGTAAVVTVSRSRLVGPNVTVLRIAKDIHSIGWLPGFCSSVRLGGPRRPHICRWEKSAGAIFPLNRVREFHRDVRKVTIGAGDGAHAAAFADAVEFGDGVVELFPEVVGAASAGSGLQLVGRFGATAGWSPVIAVLVRGLAGVGSLSCGVGESCNSSAEVSVGWCEDVSAQRGEPCRSGFFEEFLAVHVRSRFELLGGGALASGWAVRPADEGFEGFGGRVVPRTLPILVLAAGDAVDFASGDSVAAADFLVLDSAGVDPVADRLVSRLERLCGLGHGQEVVVSHQRPPI